VQWGGWIACCGCTEWGGAVRRTADVVGRDRVAADGSGLRDGREDLGDRQQERGHHLAGGRQPNSTAKSSYKKTASSGV
jgi:hypothetical protein